jgi:hypothetical protein
MRNHQELEWNEVDRNNGHPYADLVAAAREIANDPRCDLIYSERRIRLYAALAKLSALDSKPTFSRTEGSE